MHMTNTYLASSIHSYIHVKHVYIEKKVCAYCSEEITQQCILKQWPYVYCPHNRIKMNIDKTHMALCTNIYVCATVV